MSDLTPETSFGESERGSFQLHLPGLLKVLAEHLYSNRQVALRELIQNANDSCVRRATSSLAPLEYRPRLRIRLDASRGILEFADNGSGLTLDEIRDYLSTIGRSYTRELKEDLSLFSPDEAARLIGQFGFGFLSAFLLASHVEVETLSMKEGNSALLWRAGGDEHYEVSPSSRTQVGTTIRLRVKPEAAFLLDEDILLATIRQFADFLPFALYFGDESEPLNAQIAPWEAEEPAQAMAQYISTRFGLDYPLVIIRLQPYRIELGHDALEIPLEGFLFVPPGSVASVREWGDVSVYIRRMFIRDDEKHLLPSWARFVRGVIDCPILQPTASREDIHQDESYGFVRQAIEAQLTGALQSIADEEPELWKRIVQGHADVLTGWAARDDEFFERVAEIVAFRTTRGLLTLREYLALSDGGLYYVTREIGSLQEQLLAEGHGVPVIDASWFAVEPFLHKFAATRTHNNEKVRLIQLDDASDELLRPIPPFPYRSLLKHYEDRGVRAKVVSFRPESVPALMIYPRDAQFISDARGALSKDELPAPFAGLIGDYVDNLNVNEDELRGTLHLNSRNTLVRQLAAQPLDERGHQTLDLLLQIARLFAGRTLTVRDVADSFKIVTDALEGLSREAAPREVIKEVPVATPAKPVAKKAAPKGATKPATSQTPAPTTKSEPETAKSTPASSSTPKKGSTRSRKKSSEVTSDATGELAKEVADNTTGEISAPTPIDVLTALPPDEPAKKKITKSSKIATAKSASAKSTSPKSRKKTDGTADSA